ncbi:MAG: hypothetical protein ABSA02_16680 [Trebonia sp.]
MEATIEIDGLPEPLADLTRQLNERLRQLGLHPPLRAACDVPVTTRGRHAS